jgi:hypothetical protein
MSRNTAREPPHFIKSLFAASPPPLAGEPDPTWYASAARALKNLTEDRELVAACIALIERERERARKQVMTGLMENQPSPSKEKH